MAAYGCRWIEWFLMVGEMKKNMIKETDCFLDCLVEFGDGLS